MQRISITEDDLGTGASARSPAVYAPVGGPRHPDVYGPANDRPAQEANGRTGLPAWAIALLVGVLVVAIGIGAFFLGRSSGGVDQADVQQQLLTQKMELTREADQVKGQAVRAARADAARAADARVRSASRAARAEGFSAGRDKGYQEGLAAGRSEAACTTLIC